jgi:guanylate kinase
MSDSGIIFILSAPSGGGKSSIAKYLIQNNSDLWLSVSVTTRAKRHGEIEGQDYYFIDKTSYDQISTQGKFLESARVYDYFYGTPREVVFDKLKQGTSVLFDIDWQGARSIKSISEFPLVSIFILPPSLPELEQRLLARGDSVEIVAKRMLKAKEECSYCFEYDYIVVNNDFDNTIEEISAIMRIEKLKFHKQKVRELVSSSAFTLKRFEKDAD